MAAERTVRIACAGDQLIGILHDPGGRPARALLVVVGGPQYRVGSHRQFVLLARQVAASGIPVLRFDYRGMGDSDGKPRSFEDIDTDIGCAIDSLFAQLPGLREVVIWGLCDAASAALFYVQRGDSRVSGLVLLNPWVRTEAGQAKAYLRHYYLTRLFDRELWQRIRQGEFQFLTAARSLAGMLLVAVNLLPKPPPSNGNMSKASSESPLKTAQTRVLPAFPLRMLQGIQVFKGRILLILSGDDLTAAEFKDTVAASRDWRLALERPLLTRLDFPGANHTFARQEWRQQIGVWTIDWLRK